MTPLRSLPVVLTCMVLPALAVAWNRYAVVFPLREALPDPALTPGRLAASVTQANIHRTICVRGWTRTVRPPEWYTEKLKRRQIREYGYADRRLGDYEEDHLLCRVSELLRTGTTLGNSRREPRRDTKSVARTAGFPIRDNG